nr:putative late blight resistance protein homolog R1B-17 [Ipomoea batatas]
MKEVTKKITGVSVKAEDDIEAELLKAHHYHKLEETLQRVVHDVEELMQITRNTNPTVGSSYQRTSDVEDEMVGHSEELDEVMSMLHLVFLEIMMKEQSENIRKVSVEAEDDIEAELLNLVQALQLVDEDIEELMQTTRNTNHHHLVNNLTVGAPSQPTSNVEDNAMVGHSKELDELRHLEIYHQISIDLPKVIREDLQTLYWLCMSECTMEVFSRIPNVKELGIIASSASQGLDNLCCSLKDLEKLKVIGSYHHLHLPPHIEAKNFPQKLQKLTFERTLIPWEAMSIISMLPNLEVLKLKNFACVGEEWELIEEGGFPKLKVLLISVTNLKEWKANVDTPFPKLERLLLRNCFELKEMPEWIENAITLQLIKLEYCYASLVGSAQRIKEEQLDYYGNDMLDVIHSNTRPDDEDHAKEEDRSNEQTCEVESVCHDLTSLWFEARKLRITWGHDDRYWIWTFDSDSRHEVAKLKKVSAFDIGLAFDIRCLNKMSCYSAYLVFKHENGICENVYTALAAVRYEKDNARYGWMNKQIWHSNTYEYPKMESVRVEGGNHNIITVFLRKTKSYGDCGQFPDTRSDGGMEIKLGDFYVSSGNEGDVQLRLWHTSNQFWKSGFVVRGVEIRLAN